MRYLKWLLFSVAASFLAWRIVTLGMADYYASQTDSSDRALSWYARHPQAMVDYGLALVESDPGKAEEWLRQAAWENPTDGRVYMALARHWEQEGETRGAAELVTIASALAPMRYTVQLQAAEFWLRQGRLDKALAHWSVALQLRPSISSHLYPVLLRLIENPDTLPSFAPLLDNPPDWWEDFFSYVANNAISLDTVRALYKAQRQDDHLASEKKRKAYMTRLQRDGQGLEFYLTWLNSLGHDQLRVLGNVYNGGFELPFSEVGFDWHAPKIRGVVVETAPTYGMWGNKALHIVFQGLRVQFRHLYQYLLLDPGRYQLRGWVRPDSLQTERGVQWTVNCAQGNADLLGASERFLGTDQWRSFAADFEVPTKECPVQLLRLELAGRVALEFEASGAVWFDELRVSRVEDK